MSAATSPGPNNLLILAVLGIGAYYLMSRRAMAQPVYQQGGQPGRTAQNASIIGAGLGALNNLFRGSGSSGSGVPLNGTYDGRSQTQWDVTPQGPGGPQYNNPSAYVANDGVAANPPFNSAYDFSNEYWY
ncbi:hypothetical protein LJR129_002491 [Acidovorax sp. LjRoot129]|uniref:hypothetical protein n=1 Tax=Acidovorax sp. LjRoot129 TaxID=3342260 RepID=UPI003ECC8A3E